MWHSFLSDSTFYDLLLRFDLDLAASARAAGCGCGGVLHSARYPRKPRGGPRGLGATYEKRLSFCCAEEGCRRRTTPPSMRFLGRRVYLGAVVVLISAMHDGVRAKRAAQLHELVGVTPRTLKRWRRWWHESFVAGAFWKSLKGRFVPPVELDTLPASLLERFAGQAPANVLRLLHFLAPLTTTSCDLSPRFSMGAFDPQKMRL